MNFFSTIYSILLYNIHNIHRWLWNIGYETAPSLSRDYGARNRIKFGMLERIEIDQTLKLNKELS